MYIPKEQEELFILDRAIDMERQNPNRQRNLVQSIVSAGPNEWSYLLAVLGFALLLICGLAGILFCWWFFAQVDILASAPSLQTLASVGNRLMLPHWIVILSALTIVAQIGSVSSVVALTAASHTRPTVRLGILLGSVTLIVFFVPENLQQISPTRTEFAVIYWSVALLWATGVYVVLLRRTEQQTDGR